MHPATVSTPVDPRYNYALSQVFGAALLKRLDDKGYEHQMRALLNDSGLYPYADDWHLSRGLEATYCYLQQHYRCEYVYKNEIANQLLLARHNDNSATLLRELASDTSIADIVIVNGNTTAYEIKTELDNFDRLEGQLVSYQGLYDHVYLVTHPKAVATAERSLPAHVGLIIMGDGAQLTTARESSSLAPLFDPSKAVLSLRQAELVAAYERREGKLPAMGTALVWSYCHDWYTSLPQEQAHVVFYESLKSRRPAPHQFNLIMDCDNYLKMVFLGRELSKRACITIRERLGIHA